MTFEAMIVSIGRLAVRVGRKVVASPDPLTYGMASGITSSIICSIGSSMSENEKVRENRLRRIAERRGMILSKSRRRDPKAIDYGGYMLIDATSNAAIMGSDSFAFSASLDDIENWLESE
ncbi:hypothetical protein [Sphingobium sp. CFD-1]|uniref:hypothetical protein n=1 Tax=Sphingobium sp. CFD-1 TaxID=2878545 RepID=UPI00214BE471|nr:hypothetical protein [Sphingobium sp. CFD-1]